LKTVQDALVDAIDVIRTLQREKAELARQHDQTVEFYETQLRIARGGGRQQSDEMQTGRIGT